MLSTLQQENRGLWLYHPLNAARTSSLGKTHRFPTETAKNHKREADCVALKCEGVGVSTEKQCLAT